MNTPYNDPIDRLTRIEWRAIMDLGAVQRVYRALDQAVIDAWYAMNQDAQARRDQALKTYQRPTTRVRVRLQGQRVAELATTATRPSATQDLQAMVWDLMQGTDLNEDDTPYLRARLNFPMTAHARNEAP